MFCLCACSDGDDNDGDGDDDDGEEGDADAADADDDPEPPIPVGWERVELGQPFNRFLLFTSLAQKQPPTWHDMHVVKVLQANRRDGCTHDAHLDGEPAARKRGVCLSEDWHGKGCWVGLKQVGVAPPPAQAPTSAAPTAAPKPQRPSPAQRSKAQKRPPTQPAGRVSKRARVAPESFMAYRQQAQQK